MSGFGIGSFFIFLVIIILIWIFGRKEYLFPWQRRKKRLNHIEEEISKLKEEIKKSKEKEGS